MGEKEWDIVGQRRGCSECILTIDLETRSMVYDTYKGKG